MALTNLLDGSAAICEEIKLVHRSSFSRLRERFVALSFRLIPGKGLDLCPSVSLDRLEEGLQLVLRDTDRSTSDGSSGHRHPSELSGGQKALAGLSFIFACALDRRSPL